MKRYWVEFIDHYEGLNDHVGVYMYAYSQEQIRDALSEYALICIDLRQSYCAFCTAQ